MEDSEYYVQIFLFVATILCYIILAVFVFYGLYYCCLRACILRTKTKRQEEDAEEEDKQVENSRYFGRVKLQPFSKDSKHDNVINASNSNTLNYYIPPATKKTNINTNQNTPTINSNTIDERNPFVDKKYYDIFVA